MSLALRPAAPGDVPALLAIEAIFPTDRIDRRGFHRQIRSPTATILVAELGGLLGYALLHRRSTSRIGRLSSIAVRPEAGRRGVARRLLAAIEAEAARHGCDRLRLEVRADNEAAQRLYEGAGYRQFETVPDYYEDGAAARRYEKPLA